MLGGTPACLRRLLEAAAVPASLQAEAVYAVLLHLTLQNQGTPARVSASNQLQRLWLAQSAGQPAQLPSLRPFHNTAVHFAEDPVPAAAPFEQQDTAAAGQPAQAAEPAGPPAPAVPAARHESATGPQIPAPNLNQALQEESRRQGQAGRGRQQRRGSKLAPPSAPPAQPSYMLGGLEQQLREDEMAVKRSQHAQRVAQQLQQMEQRHQSRQQQQTPVSTPHLQPVAGGLPAAAAAAAARTPQAAAVQDAAAAQHQQQQQLLLHQQRRKELLRKGLAAIQQGKSWQAAIQEDDPQLQEEQQPPPPQQQGQRLRGSLKEALNMIWSPRNIAAVVRAQQQPSQAMAAAVGEAAAVLSGSSSTLQQPPASAQLPPLVQYMLQQEPSVQPAVPAVAVSTCAQDAGHISADSSSSAEGMSNSSAGVLWSASEADTDTEADVLEYLSAQHGTARYSNWVDLDLDKVLITDFYDTFLGIWPGQSDLPPLQLSVVLEQLQEELDSSEPFERAAAAAPAAAASAATAAGDEAGEAADAAAGERWEQDSPDTAIGAAAAEAGTEADFAAVLQEVLGGNFLGSQREQQEQQQQGGQQQQEVDQQGEEQQQPEQRQQQQLEQEQPGVQLVPAAAAPLQADAAGWEHSMGDDTAATLAADSLWEAADTIALSTAAAADGDDAGAAAAEAAAAMAAEQAADTDVLHAAVLRQQRLQEAAAAAGTANQQQQQQPGAAAGSADGHQQDSEPMWSVATMFDSIDSSGIDSSSTLSLGGSLAPPGDTSVPGRSGLSPFQQLLEGSEWVLEDLLGEEDSQFGDQEDIYQDCGQAAAAAAEAAVLASDAAAAAAAAASPPQLQWPSYVPFDLALQHAVQQLEQGVSQGQQLAGAFGLDRDSSKFDIQGSLPFAWMYAAGPSSSSSRHPYGLAHMIQWMQDMQPNGSWRFELQQRPGEPLLPLVDSSLLQHVLLQVPQVLPPPAAAAAAGKDSNTGSSSKRPADSQQAGGPPGAGVGSPVPQLLRFGSDLWQAAKLQYGLGGGSSGSGGGGGSSSGQDSTQAAAAPLPAAEANNAAGWSWESQQQQQQNAEGNSAGLVGSTAAALSSTAQRLGCAHGQLQGPISQVMSADGLREGPAFVTRPTEQKYPHTAEEQVLLARVLAMSAGTHWEAVMWSVFTQQAATLHPHRSRLQPNIPQFLQKGINLAPQQQQWRPATQQQRQPRRHKQQQQQPTADMAWFEPILYAAFAATQRTGQLVLSQAPTAAPVQPPLLPVADGSSIGSNSSNAGSTSCRTSAQDQVQQQQQPGWVTVGLQAAPPHKPGWDPLAHRWTGTWLSRTAPTHPTTGLDHHQQQQQLPLWLQAEMQLARQQHHDRVPVGPLRHQPDAAWGVVLDELQACSSSAALLECMQQHEHYLKRYQQMPAAALQQAAKLWDASGGVGTTASAAAAAAAAAAANGGDAAALGRHHKHRPQSQQRPTVHLGALTAASSSSGTGSAHTAAAAAGGNLDAVLQQLSPAVQLGSVALSSAAAMQAGNVFSMLVAWLIGQPQPLKVTLSQYISQPLDEGLSTSSRDSSSRRRATSSSSTTPGSSGSSSSSGGSASSAAAAFPNRSQCLLQLLRMGVTHRGRALPRSTSLLPLLQHQQVNDLQEIDALGLCQQLLGKHAALQRWPSDEQAAAFQLLHRCVKKLPPVSLMAVLQCLVQQQHLAFGQEPAQLYLAVLGQLAVSAAAVHGSTPPAPPQLLKDFEAVSPQLLLLAQHACLSAGALAQAAYSEGDVLPGGEFFASRRQPAPWGFAEGPAVAYKRWAWQLERAHVKRLADWRRSAAATPAVADAVVKAAALGQLQQVGAVLRYVLGAAKPGKQPQQLRAAEAAELLQLLALSSPFLSYGSIADATFVAERLQGDAAGLLAGAQAIARLPDAVAGWLVQRQQQQGKPMQQLAPEVALKTIWAALQLQLPHEAVLACVLALCEPSTTTSSSGSGKSSASSKSSGSKGSGGGHSTAMHSWPITELNNLCDMIKAENCWYSWAKAGVMDVMADAAAARIRELAAELTASGDSSYAQLGRQRGAAARDSVREALKADIAAAADVAFHFSAKGTNMYYPDLIAALQEFLVAAAQLPSSKPSPSGSRTSVIDAFAFQKVLYALAAFDRSSEASTRAVRRLLPIALPKLSQQALSRVAWSLAVLDERDWRVWTDIKHSIEYKTAGVAAAMEDGGARADGPGFSDSFGVLSQLHQAHVFVEHCVQDAAPLLPPRLARKALEAHVKQSNDPNTSQLQRDVGHMLGEMQASPDYPVVSYELEHKTLLGSTDIRVVVEGGDYVVAVEVDGPFHYAQNSRNTRTGSTVLRDRLLEVKGFAVLPLPYWEIQQQRDAGVKARLHWLEKLLRQAAATAPRSKAGAPSRVDLASYRKGK